MSASDVATENELFATFQESMSFTEYTLPREINALLEYIIFVGVTEIEMIKALKNDASSKPDYPMPEGVLDKVRQFTGPHSQTLFAAYRVKRYRFFRRATIPLIKLWWVFILGIGSIAYAIELQRKKYGQR